MPYINREDRHPYQPFLDSITKFDSSIESKSNDYKFSYLSYIIYSLINTVWGPEGKRRYVDHQDVTGFLMCASMEYKRRYNNSNKNKWFI